MTTVPLQPPVSLALPTNTKLGPGLHSWSITPGRAGSCPGETALCKAVCYAKHGHFLQTTVKTCHARNFAFSRTPGFAQWMQASLRTNLVRVLRVHVSGDFYGIPYIRAWRAIVQASPETVFLAYTRSWRDESLFAELRTLAALPNMRLWWSIDRETGPAPTVRGVRRAYMAIDDADALTAPDDCDLIFRVRTGSVLKKANGIQVCPPENGQATATKITCTRCGLCWRNAATPSWEQLFDQPALDLGVPPHKEVIRVSTHAETRPGHHLHGV